MKDLWKIVLTILFIALMLFFIANPFLFGLTIIGIICLVAIFSLIKSISEKIRHPYIPPPRRIVIDDAAIAEANREKRESTQAALLKLRKEIVDSGFPAIASESGLLRERLLMEFALRRPKSRDEWLQRIDFFLRDQTDHTQVPIYLDEILNLIAKHDS
jgi:hypothetical protein